MLGSGKVPELILNNAALLGTPPVRRLMCGQPPSAVRSSEARQDLTLKAREMDWHRAFGPRTAEGGCLRITLLGEVRFAFQFQFPQIEKQRQAERHSQP